MSDIEMFNKYAEKIESYFDDDGKALEWWMTNNNALGGISPYEMKCFNSKKLYNWIDKQIKQGSIEKSQTENNN